MLKQEFAKLRAARAMVAVMCLTPAGPALAQSYTALIRNAAYVPLPPGTPAVTLLTRDDGATMIPVGFSFPYFGQTFTHVNVTANGYLWMPIACGTGCTSNTTCDAGTNLCAARRGPYDARPFPTAGEPSGVIAPYWDDLELVSAAPASELLSATLGAAPNRVLVVEWRNVRHLSVVDSWVSFQVRLYEDGLIQLHYGPTSGPGDSDFDGSIGIEDPTEQVGINALPCSAATAGCSFSDLASLSGKVIDIAVFRGPELTGAVRPPPGGDPGAAVAIAVQAQNIGTQTTTSGFSADVYFSTDPVIAPDDTRLGAVTFLALAAGQSRTATLSTRIPAGLAPGTYWVGAILDPARRVPEVSRSNNVLVSAPFLLGPDVAGQISAQATSGPGELLPVTLTVLSQGSPLPRAAYAISLSSDATADSGDRTIATGTVAINGRPSATVELEVPVPADLLPGAYYVIARLDPRSRIAELNENNNVAVSASVTDVVGPDIVAVEVSGALFAFRAERYKVIAKLRNSGGTRARSFYYSFYFSDNQLITVSDPLLGEIGPIDLPAGAEITVSHELSISSSVAAGRYYLGLIADSTSQVLEGQEPNNIKRMTTPVVLRDPAPDFAGRDVRFPGRGAAGEALTVERALLNLGNASGRLEYTLFVSSDSTIDPLTDVPVGAGEVEVGARGESFGVDLAHLPVELPPGPYYLGYVLDPSGAVSELDENNNVAVASARLNVEAAFLGIATRTLPPGTVGLPYQFDLVARGGTGQYGWSIADGRMPAGLTLDATGRIRGTPEEEAVAQVTFAVNDGQQTARFLTSLVISEPTLDLDVITHAVPPAFVGQAYRMPLIAIGGIPPYLWTATGVIPAGLEVTPAGWLIGTGSRPAIESITFHCRDAVGTAKDRVVTVRVVDVSDAVRFTSDVLPDGTVGAAYDQSLNVEKGTSPFVFDVVGGALPPGLALSPCEAQSGTCVRGTPTADGTHTFSVRVIDERGDFDINRFTVDFTQDTAIRFVTSSLPPATRGIAYVKSDGSPIQLQAVAPSEGKVAYRLLAGDLPPGLTLTSSGAVTGAATATGIFAFTVEATDPANAHAYRALAIVVDEPAVEQPPVGGEGGCGCRAAPRTGAPRLWPLVVLLGLGLALRRRRRAFWAFALAMGSVGVAPPATAQTSIPYFVTELQEPFVPRSGGSQLAFSQADDGSANVTLPFPFRFYGTSHNDLNVSTNGYVTFGGLARATSPQRFPSGTEPNDVIAVFWDDLENPIGSLHIEGAAPSRVAIIQWLDVSPYTSSLSSPGTMRFQLWLYEGDAGRFELHYGPSVALAPGLLAAGVGFEDSTGQEGRALLACSPVCSERDIALLENRVIRVMQDAGPELTAISISGPARVIAGVPFTADFSLQSVHQGPLGPFRYALYLSPAGTITPHQALFTSPPISLTPYQRLEGHQELVPPIDTPPGPYRLALVVDTANDVAEPDENNNLVFSNDDVRVVERRPDLLVSSVLVPSGQVSPGSHLDVTVALANRGNLDAPPVEWRLVLSRNSVLSMDDLALHTATVTLPRFGTSTVAVPIELPADLIAGRYTLGAMIDPANRVAELDEINNSAASADPLTVGVDFLEVTTTQLPAGYVGTPYTAYLSAAGGDGTHRWDITQGALPTGLALLSTTGEIRGTPRSTAQERLTVRVTSGGRTATKSLQLEITDPGGRLTIVTRSLLPGVVGLPYPPEPQRIWVANVTGTVSFSLLSSPIPGLTLDHDGTLSGVPSQAGDFLVGIQAEDAVGTATRTLPLTLAELGHLAVVAAALPDATIDEEYQAQLQTIGGTGSASISFDLGGHDLLPDGLALTSAGLIVGTPTKVGRWEFVVHAVEGTGVGAPQDSANFSLSVLAGTGFGITPSSLPAGQVGQVYDVTLEARGGTPPFVWRLAFPGALSLPRGLRFEVIQVEGREKLHFTGTPEVVPTDGDLSTGGAVSFLVSVDDASGRHVEVPMAIRVLEPPPPQVAPDDGGCGCRAAGNGAHAWWVLLGLVWLGRFARRGRRNVR